MIVATTTDGTVLVNSTSPSGEKIIVYKYFTGLYHQTTILPKSNTVNIVGFGSVDKLVEQLPIKESWFLQGVKDELIETEIKKQLSSL